MYHTIVVILLSGYFAATCVAQEQPTAASPKVLTDAETATPNSKAIVLVIDADSQQSVAVKQVVEALEKAGITTSKAAETTSPANSSIRVTLRMRRDESYEKIKLLVEALRNTGVQQISLREGGSLHEGKEQNLLDVEVGPGDLPEFRKIESAAQAVQAQCGLTVLVESSFGPGKLEIRRTQDVANLSSSDSSEKADPAMDSASSHDASEIADLRTKYEAANKRVHDLAESLRQTPDAAKKSKLRTAVQRAFTLRQSLLRAELKEMQARLEKTQKSLDMRDRSADQIVDRRVEDLLNPELKWNGDGVTNQPLTQSVSPDAPANRLPAAADPKAAMLAKLQGAWVLDGKMEDNSRIMVEIRDNVMTWSVDVPLEPGDGKPPIFLLKLGEPGTPQTIDLTMNPNDGPERQELLGIVEIGDELVRFCVNMDDSGLRPEVFAVGKAADLWILRRPANQSPLSIGLELAQASVGNPPEPALPTKVTVNFHPQHDEQFSVGEIVDLEANYPRLGKPVTVKLLTSLVVSAVHVDAASSRMTDIELTANDMQAYLLQGMMNQAPEYLKLVKHSPNDNAFIDSYGVNSAACTAFIVDAVPNSALLAKLQGSWDMHMIEADPNPPGGKEDAVIEGDLMTITITLNGKTVTIPVQLKLDGSPETYAATMDGKPIVLRRPPESWPSDLPQRIDLIHFPNDKQEREVLPGIIEFREDSVRICMANSSSGERPEVFVVGEDANVWELRRKSAATELEGNWKLESFALQDGTPQDLSLAYAPQLVIRGNEVEYDTGRNPSRIEIDPTQKTLSYQKDSEKAPSLYRYSLGPNQLTLRDEGQCVLVYRRQAASPNAALATELEGDWHVVADYDHEGKLRETLPSNRSFRGDQSSFVWPGHRHDCRIKVDPIKNTLWSYSRDENGSYSQDYYELKGNQLILRNEPDAVGYEVFERGHVRIPSVVPLATREQIVLWRSAIVEIVVFSLNSQAPRERVIGRGVVISSDGKILSQMSVNENGDLAKEKIKARFDDGTVIPLKLIEEAGQGWSVLLPELPIRVNHYFELSTSEVQLQDEVRVWGPEDSPFLSESLAPFGNTVTALDRKYPALGIAVWQLRFSRRPVLGTPILDADGDLLGITITGARDLLLAIPVSQLKTMFPKTFGQQLNDEPQSAKELPDWLLDLQGTWIVTDSPIKVDENSGGQMKEIRIDRDQWSIVWTAKPGDPDRVESLRVVRPDVKNLYAIDLVEPSTGKVVYPSLYELDQAGLTFCYGHLGKRPKEIGNVVTIKLSREQSLGPQ